MECVKLIQGFAYASVTLVIGVELVRLEVVGECSLGAADSVYGEVHLALYGAGDFDSVGVNNGGFQEKEGTHECDRG